MTVDGFARTWESLEETKEAKQERAEALFTAFMEKMARAHFGASIERWRAFAQALEHMSNDARQKRFDKLLGTSGSIQDAWDLYERWYNGITPLFMAHFAPNAMTPDEFVDQCSFSVVRGAMPKMGCPCCSGSKFEDNDAFPPHVDSKKLHASFWCLGCGFPLDVVIEFE